MRTRTVMTRSVEGAQHVLDATMLALSSEALLQQPTASGRHA